MALSLFDVQAGFGGPTALPTPTVTASEWIAQMRQLDIGEAVVRFVPDEGVRDPRAANRELYAVCQAHPELRPCPILLPSGGQDVPSEQEQVAEAISHGAGAALLRPTADYWHFEEWSGGPLLRALEERRLPAFCSVGKVTLPQVADLAGRYPKLPLILAEVQYLQHRSLVPLLAAFPNAYLSVGSNYVVYQGLETLVATVGPDRLLFGTGFPHAEPMGAITMLTYADLSPEVKAQIGMQNLQRLIEGIER